MQIQALDSRRDVSERANDAVYGFSRAIPRLPGETAALAYLAPTTAFDEIMATAVKRQHEPQRIVGDLLNAEINEKQARSIKYQLTIAKLPLAKDDLEDFQFEDSPR